MIESEVKQQSPREEKVNPEGKSAKKQIKCKHFPNCNNSDEDCPFIHPTENCKFFPACTNGDKCIYLHPEIECKFGLQCTRQNCVYKHPKGKGKLTSNPAAFM